MQDGFDYIVVFGAAVTSDGKPSAVLRHRLDAARKWAAGRSQVKYLVSGGIGCYPPAEAVAMRAYLVGWGVQDHMILIEPEGRDTLSSAIRCIEILRRQPDVRSIVLCSSSFHLPRCRLIFRILGVATGTVAIRSDRDVMGSRGWLRASAREVPAIVWDCLLALARRLMGVQSPAVLGSILVLISVILSVGNPLISA